ncbi:flavodoxin family protein [Oceanirhabdus seepicola]|uniref:Flavodoxin domain-containing protein n=1 Tax=Oceanirhabdus seepicola TaxID=2828781 RepID=A0A9J6P7Z2_9CLOT|nr:flavodoxin family protein [Oceanirhabdus seepicola]MCM1992110.1 flavodoxin domain-containing protein [Oceanirhabdus seepicola]
MKYLVIYSSETGNTKKLANTIGESLGNNFDIAHVSMAPEPFSYDVLFVGYRLTSGSIDDNLKEYLSSIRGKKIFLFGTMGANPSSPYGGIIKKNIQNIFEQNNTVIGHFLCQGQISNGIMDKWFNLLEKTPDDLHALKQLENYKSALKHPNENDMLELRNLLIQCL